MKAEIIAIGDELLLGQVIDTNSVWLGSELNALGIKVIHKCAISDSREAILEALSQASSRANIIIITGGLGPTKDDITKHTLCEYFNTSLTKNEAVYEWVRSIFEKRNLPMLESNNQQAMVPQNCEVLWNKSGTAPGMWFNENNTIFISMPGVPFEMKTIFAEEAIPKLKTTFSFPVLLHRTILTCGIGESFLARKIESLEDALPSYIKLAYLPSVGMVRLRFSASGTDKQKLESEMNTIIDSLYQKVGEYIFGEEEENLAEVVGKLLLKKNATVGSAESCTGGNIAHTITLNPGSSAYFKGSVVAYANEIKTSVLGVKQETLKNFGAVSEACVIEMAEGLRAKLNTDYAMATSGVAGPGGGSPEKPVGFVWIAVSGPNGTMAKSFNMGDNRERTILRTTLQALDMLRRELLKK